MHGHFFTTGSIASVAVWAVGATLISAVGLVLALAVLVATVVPIATSGCEELDGSGEPVAPPVGSVGGVGGSGITPAELRTVRSGPLAGSAFTSGDFHATAYGPPWGGIQGPGVATAGGIRIDGGAPKKYFIATDPDVISLGQWVYVQPNPFGWQGAFLAADTGSAIMGRDVDFYDWRGRAYQNRWNQQVRVSDRPFPAADGESEGSPVGLAVNATAARDVATEITGQPVGFALVDRDGHVLASVAPNETNRSASITEAMILVALMHEARSRELTSGERQQAAAMIRRSDNEAANALFARVGTGAVDAVARRAGMTSFELVRHRQGADGYVLGFSRVSAVDQARLFARIDELVAPRHRAFALGELESIEGAGRFGILDAGLNAVIRSKGGWRPESDGGWRVNQAAQIAIGDGTYGFAVVLGKQQTFEAGAARIAEVAAAAFTERTTAAMGDCAGVAPLVSTETGERVGEIARRYLGKDARRQSFTGFRPPMTQLQWCAWFSTNVWRLAGVPIEVSHFSGYHHAWAKPKGMLFKAPGSRPRGMTPPVGSALMYGSGPENAGTSEHVNLVDDANPDGTFMITGGNQDSSRVTRQGPCRMTRTDPARLSGPGCDPRPIYAIAAPTPAD